jgi:hypothetical protein
MKKKLIAALCVVLVLLCAFFLLHGRVIGTVKGAEMEQIVIDGVTYVQNNNTGLSYADKGRFLGRAVNDKVTFRVYTVRGDTEEQYLYRLWEWEGAFYEKQN